MTKGKPWTTEEEQKLVGLVREGKSVDVISKILGRTEEAIYMKMKRLGLEVVVSEKNQLTTSSPAGLSEDLPSIEDVLKLLSGALRELNKPGLEKKEVMRLRSLIQGVKIYKEMFFDFVHYSEIEAALVHLRRDYESLNKKTKKDASRPDSS